MFKSLIYFINSVLTYHTSYSVATNSLPLSRPFPGATINFLDVPTLCILYALCNLLQLKDQFVLYLESQGCHSTKQ